LERQKRVIKSTFVKAVVLTSGVIEVEGFRTYIEVLLILSTTMALPMSGVIANRLALTNIKSVNTPGDKMSR